MKRLLVALALAASLVSLARAEPVNPTPAPAWTLTDLAGKTVSSADLKGKVVIVDFWATWCPPCRAEIPGYVDLSKKYAAQGLVVVGISMDQTGPATVKKFVDKYAVSYPIFMADDTIFKNFGGGESIPMTVIIDRDGNIRDRKTGAVPTAEYEKTVQSFLK